MLDSLRSPCPIASSLDLFGDRWTLVLLRDVMMGKSTFSELLDGPERITTNVLTDRLSRMEQGGLLSKAPYSERPRRYRYQLTQKSRDLLPVLQALAEWGTRHIPDRWQAPDRFMQAMPADLPLARPQG